MLQANIVILAAGQGKRLRSGIAKPLLPLAGTPLIGHVLTAAAKLSPRQITVVIPPQSDISTVVSTIAPQAVFALQKTSKGTANALQCAMSHQPKDGVLLVLCADTPLLPVTVLRQLARAAAAQPAFLSFLTESPAAYGRIVRQVNGRIARIVEAKDASREERKINEVYAGVMAVPIAWLRKTLPRINKRNAAKEFYLTDLAHLAAEDGIAAKAICAEEKYCLGVNTMADLENAERVYRQEKAADLLQRGVRLIDATRLDIRGEVQTGRDVEIDVNVILSGGVKLAGGCKIGAHCIIDNCRIGKNTIILPFSHLSGAVIGANCIIGPYARIRPDTQLADEVKIGNFVEVKKSAIGRGSKAGHLSYLGDATVGAAVNIGAGVITCNYDGKKKRPTIIKDGVFIGSDTQLVAPLTVGKEAYIGAGTTVTKSIPANTLALSRNRQTTMPWRRRR